MPISTSCKNQSKQYLKLIPNITHATICGVVKTKEFVFYFVAGFNALKQKQLESNHEKIIIQNKLVDHTYDQAAIDKFQAL